MAEPEDAIRMIHALSSSEISFDYHHNSPVKGIVGATRAMESNRVAAFQMIIGRKPTDEEKEKLLYGDS